MNLLRKILGGNGNNSLKRMLAEGAWLVDVRSTDEFNAGHASKAINIPLQLISLSAEKLKGRTIIAVCKSGARSAMAVTILKEAGIIAYNGGAWSDFAGL